MARGCGFYNKDWFSIKEGKPLLYESIIRILMTTPGERVMRPNFGAGMRDRVFDLITPDYLQDLAIKIHTSLIQEEPRVVVKEVQTEFDSDEGTIRVKVISERVDNPAEEETMTFKYNTTNS